MKIVADTNTFLAVVLEEPEKKWLIEATEGHDLVSPAVLPKPREDSPFDVPGVKSGATTSDILAAIAESRSKTSQQRHSGSDLGS